MALNKARTSIWVKTLIIILIVAFVSLFMYTGIVGIVDLFRQTPTTSPSSSVDPVTALEQQYQPTVSALKGVAESNPTSYTAQVQLANIYFEWARQLSEPASAESQITTAAMTAAIEKWSLAKATYDKATELTKTLDPDVQTDRSYATFYSNDATAAINIAKAVVKKVPTFANAWLDLGWYYDVTGKTTLAIQAYKKYVALDPNGQNVASVNDRLKTLSGSKTATASPRP